MVERIAKMIENIISNCDELNRWKSYEERGIEGVFPPLYDEIDATDPKSTVYGMVVIGLQTWLHNYTEETTESTWSEALDKYFTEHKGKAHEAIDYARNYAIIRMKVIEMQRKFGEGPLCDSFFDALEDSIEK